MKQTKKIVSILLTLVMVFAMAIPAFATQEGTLDDGSITITGAAENQTYKAYQIMYLESYNATTGAYSYKANTAWKKWLEDQTEYVKVDADGYVTWNTGKDTAENTKEKRAAELAKLAQNYVQENNIAVDATSENASFSNLKLGYYLINTNLGTICSLTTAKPDVTINEKNGTPSIEKQVKEDSTDKWGKENTAEIGDTVYFKSTVHAEKGAKGYVVHDQMSEGLKLDKNSIEVKVVKTETKLTEGTDYNVAFDVSCKDNKGSDATCDFHITFTQTYLDTITANTDIVITYTAVLNDKAVISTGYNTNYTKLDYGDVIEGVPSGSTAWDETKTYTFMFDIVKTDSEKNLLNGAKFELYDAQTNGTKIALVKESEVLYRVATKAEKDVSGFTSAVIEAGKVTVKGLDANTTYWLEETEAPAGYNKLSERVKVEIKEANLSTTMTGDTWSEENGGVQITNNTGAELPSTGGIGTTIFYALGIMLAAGAAIVLVVRRRMRTE